MYLCHYYFIFFPQKAGKVSVIIPTIQTIRLRVKVIKYLAYKGHVVSVGRAATWIQAP